MNILSVICMFNIYFGQSMNRILRSVFLRTKSNYNFLNNKYTYVAQQSVNMPEIDSSVIIEHSKLLLPELSYNNHKGQSGRIGVFGGSLEFTGAPYYSGYSALRCGVDLVYIFSAVSAAQAIKTYSPELMVMPYLDSNNATDNISLWLERLHAILIGPGLGRNDKVFNVLTNIISLLNSNSYRSIPIVLDADGLFYLSKYPDLFKDYNNHVYITPNLVEYARLLKSVLGINNVTEPDVNLLNQLSENLGKNVTVILKGNVDIIAKKNLITKCSTQGSPRRCGGQGDLLSGILTAFAAWVDIKKPVIKDVPPELVAAYSACHIVKECNRLVFNEKGRGMLVTDMLEKVCSVSSAYFGESNK